MRPYSEVLVACRLARGAFSGERVFRVQLADGPEHVGVAPVNHCHHRDGANLGPDDPPVGQAIEGAVEGLIVRDGIADVMVPDGETIRVSINELSHAVKVVSYMPMRS